MLNAQPHPGFGGMATDSDDFYSGLTLSPSSLQSRQSHVPSSASLRPKPKPKLRV